MAVLHMKIGQSLSFEELKTNYPKGTVAVDGAVRGFSRRSPTHSTWDHHEGDRLALPSSAEQVYAAIMSDTLFEGVSLKCMDELGMLANDADQDVCLCWYLIKNACQIMNCRSPEEYKRLKHLVRIAGLMDVTAGAAAARIPTSWLEILEWIFEPYYTLRLSGRIGLKDSQEFIATLVQVEKRIERYVQGNGERLELDMRVDIVGGSPGKWLLVWEVGPSAAYWLAQHANGLPIVSFREYRPGSNDIGWVYTIRTGYTCPAFRLPVICDMANQLEAKINPNYQGPAFTGQDYIGGNRDQPGGSLIIPQGSLNAMEHLVDDSLLKP